MVAHWLKQKQLQVSIVLETSRAEVTELPFC
jgi:hypothetical protein